MEYFTKYSDKVQTLNTIRCVGSVQTVRGLLIESHGPQAVVGEMCEIILSDRRILAEVVGLHGRLVQLMPFSSFQGIEIGSLVVASGTRLQAAVSENMLGRVLDALGNPIDDKGPLYANDYYPTLAAPPDVLNRRSIREQVGTGVRAIDGIMPVGKGQRMGIFSGSGVGKSTLLGMIARNTSADVNVIALIGERGREVKDFIENDLGVEGLKRSVVLVSSSDAPPAARLKGAYVATAIAEYFRDQGQDVMLLFDSITRFARAQREIGLATGESPATRGFPPSTFSILPQLLERCGTSNKGTITGFYTILVDGDDLDEPVSDNVRGILDGHIILSRHLAHAYHYPAIDVVSSISRLASQITNKDAQEAAGYMKSLTAVYQENEDLINIGAYVSGSNARLDDAIKRRPEFNTFLQQAVDERSDLATTCKRLSEITSMPITLPVSDVSVKEDNTKIPHEEVVLS